jgi:uncharacterized tellurite resistance protein B-like protein
MLPELRDLYAGVAVHATQDDEHAAALELLILVMRADRRLRLDESDEIEAFTDDHEWESDTFSLANRYGPAVAKVRTAEGTPGGVDALLADIDNRIASRVMRSELVGAARSVADADGDRAATEDRIIAKVIAHFG